MSRYRPGTMSAAIRRFNNDARAYALISERDAAREVLAIAAAYFGRTFTILGANP